MIIGHCTYKIKKGQRSAFLKALTEIGFIEKANKEEGNFYYTPYLPTDDEDSFFVSECWENGECLENHLHTPHIKELDKLTELYIEGLTLDFYDGDMKRTCEYKTAAELIGEKK